MIDDKNDGLTTEDLEIIELLFGMNVEQLDAPGNEKHRAIRSLVAADLELAQFGVSFQARDALVSMGRLFAADPEDD
jgi:hypothetical protein